MPTLINLMSNYFIPRASYINLVFVKKLNLTVRGIQRGRKRSPPPKNKQSTTTKKLVVNLHFTISS